MAHLSLGLFHPSSPSLLPYLSPPNPNPSSLPRHPLPLSRPHPSSSSSSNLSRGTPPTLPFHLLSPGAHQWFFSAASLNSGSSGVATAEAEEREAGGKGLRLVAQNIPWTYTAEDVRSVFQRHGTVTDVELSMHNSTRNRGLAFVTMRSEEDATEALNNLNLYELEGRVIRVEFARSIKKKPFTPPKPVIRHNVFVGNLNWMVRSRDLRELFSAFNPKVLSVEVIFQTNPRRSAGYGFASFATKEEAEAAVSALTGKKIMGRPIRLVLSRKEPDDSKEKSINIDQKDETSIAETSSS